MKTKLLTACVLEAREVLRDGLNRFKSAAELAAELEIHLDPLHATAGTLPAPVVSKLKEVSARLGRLTEKISADDIEALDILLLGIWIRLETATMDA